MEHPEDYGQHVLGCPASVWQLPEASRRPRANHLAASGPDHSDLNWLGQELGDFSAIEHSKVENWRSPHRARTRGLIP